MFLGELIMKMKLEEVESEVEANYDTELKLGDLSHLIDMQICTKNEEIFRRWVIKLNNLCCFLME